MTTPPDRSFGAFGRLATALYDRRRLAGVVFVLIGVVAAVVGLPIPIDTNLLSLLPPDEPVVVASKAIEADNGDLGILLVAFEDLEPDAGETVSELLEDAAARFDEVDEVRTTFHSLDERLARRLGALQLDPSAVEQLAVRLKGALALGPAVNPVVVQRLMDMGPLLEELAETQQAATLLAGDGHGRLLVVPDGAAGDIAFSGRLMDETRRILDELDLEARGFRLVWYGGPHRHIVEDQEGTTQDVVTMSAGSVVMVLAILLLAFRSWKTVVVSFVPLLLANLVMLAFTKVWVGALNTFTSIALAVLVGLGIDFAIHLTARLRELRADGAELRDALGRAWDLAGRPCATAGLTSAAGFLALAIAGFRGFSQLGVILAVGLLLALGFMLTVLPLFASWLDAGGSRLGNLPVPVRGSSTSTYAWAPIGLMFTTALTVSLAFLLVPTLSWNFDVSTLRREGLAFHELDPAQQAIVRDSMAPFVLSYDSREELAEAHRRFTDRLSADDTELMRVMSIESVLPSDQGARLQALGQLVDTLDHKNWRYLAATPARELFDRLKPLRGLDTSPLTRSELPEAVRAVLGAARDDQHTLILLPRGNGWNMEYASKALAEIEALAEGVPAAGQTSAAAIAYRSIQQDLPRVGLLAAVLVTLLTFLDLRRPVLVASAILTLAGGMAWVGIALAGIGVQLTPMNVMGIPILFGIGIDVVVHLVHRLAEEGPGGVRRTLFTGGVASGFSSLTTIASFLALTLAASRGVASLGTLVVVGMATVTIVSAGLLPLMWAAGWRVTGRQPGGR